MSLDSLANVKTSLLISGSTDDAVLTRLMDAADSFIAEYTSRSFEGGSFTETHAAGHELVFLRNFPVDTLTSLKVDAARQFGPEPFRGGYLRRPYRARRDRVGRWTLPQAMRPPWRPLARRSARWLFNIVGASALGREGGLLPAHRPLVPDGQDGPGPELRNARDAGRFERREGLALERLAANRCRRASCGLLQPYRVRRHNGRVAPRFGNVGDSLRESRRRQSQ